MKLRIRTGFEYGYDESSIDALDHPSINKSIARMIRDVQVLDGRREEATLAALGVTVIWYDSHEEIAEILRTIVPERGRSS